MQVNYSSAHDKNDPVVLSDSMESTFYCEHNEYMNCSTAFVNKPSSIIFEYYQKNNIYAQTGVQRYIYSAQTGAKKWDWFLSLKHFNVSTFEMITNYNSLCTIFHDNISDNIKTISSYVKTYPVNIKNLPNFIKIHVLNTVVNLTNYSKHAIYDRLQKIPCYENQKNISLMLIYNWIKLSKSVEDVCNALYIKMY